jgi:hypothetical protein
MQLGALTFKPARVILALGAACALGFYLLNEHMHFLCFLLCLLWWCTFLLIGLYGLWQYLVHWCMLSMRSMGCTNSIVCGGWHSSATCPVGAACLPHVINHEYKGFGDL